MDFKTNRPIYQQITDYCFNCILQGEWQPGGRVPSVRELAAKLTVNTHTVLKALEYLQQAMIIYPRRGMGYFLADNARTLVNDARRQRFYREVLPELFNEMEILGITLDDLAGAWKSKKE